MLYIFDWDGTLCDSLAKIVYSCQCAAVDVGLKVPSDEQAREIVGLSLNRAFEQLFPGITPLQSGALAEAYRHHFNLESEHTMHFFPGVEETLSKLLQNGHQLAVATGKSRAGLDRILSSMGLTGFFHSSRCADETQSKPHPQMLEELLQEFDLTAEQAVMIGDTEYDMEMARNINMNRIGVSYGAHSIDKLKQFEPIMCVDSFTEILRWNGVLEG